MSTNATNIQVAVRIRPLIATEQEKKLPVQWGIQNNNIYQTDDTGQMFGEVFSFDHIFGVDKTNSDIYNDIVKDFVVSSLNGLNSTIFAYGQTSSGKTYTMLGDKKDTGVMSQAIENIFDTVESSTDRKYLIRVSYIEIYNEKIYDLLDPKNKDVKIRTFFPSSVGLQNNKEEIVTCRQQMYECLKIGTLNRHIASNKVNDRSSRSHTIFKIMIESTQICDSGNSVQVSSLNLVDLAGSERVAQTKATGVRLKEGSHINKSLSALGLVIRQLSDGQEFVNFRDSKLTRLLQDSLGGNSKTLIIATITLASLEDTCSTLAFAQRAKAVKNKPHVNEILTDADVNKRYASINLQLQEKLDEQLRINEKLKETQEENNREMLRLQQQMELIEQFQHGKIAEHTPPIPRRRHTIGITRRKSHFSLFKDTEKCQDSQNSLFMEDFFSREFNTSTSTLGTIMEDDITTLDSKVGSPESSELKRCFRSLEQDYNELVTYTRDEDNLLNETVKKNEELEQQLKEAEQTIQEYQDKQKELETLIKLKEEELCTKISQLETESLIVYECYPNIIDIKNELFGLQHILINNNFEEVIKEKLEKLYKKISYSKLIIKKEILNQIIDDDHSDIVLPNIFSNFEDILTDLNSFDISDDLLGKIKEEGMEDLKVFMKIYRCLLKKNEQSIKRSGKIELDQVNNEELILQLSEKDKQIVNLENRCTVLKEKVEKMEKMFEINEKNISQFRKDIETLSSELVTKNSRIAELESFKETKDFEELENICKENEFLKGEIENNKLFNERNGMEFEQFIKKLEEKDKLLNKYETSITELREEIVAASTQNVTLQNELDNVCRENKNIKNEIDFYQTKLTEVTRTVDQLSLELLEKDKLVGESEKLRNELDTFEKELMEKDRQLNKFEILIKELREQTVNTSTENKTLQNELENISHENKLLKDEINKNINLKNEVDSYKIKLTDTTTAVDQLSLELLQKDKLIAESEKLRKELDTFIKELMGKDQQLNKCEILIKELREQTVNASTKNKTLQNELENVSHENKVLKDEINKNISLKNETDSYKIKVTDMITTIDQLSLKLIEKDKLITRIEEECEKLKNKFSELNFENKTIKSALEKAHILNESLEKELKTKISETNRIINVLKQELDNTSKQNQFLSNEITRFKNIITEQKQTIDANCDKLNFSELQLQQLNTLQLQLKEENETLKHNLIISSQKQAEYVEANQSLKLQIDHLENKLKLSVCNEKSNLGEQVQKIRIMYQNLLCSIIEYFINEQKTLLLVRHSQDERDYFKSIVKELKANNSVLKNHIIFLRNEGDCDLNGISECITKSQTIFKDYFNLEKSILKSQISELENTNKEYLKEIMAIKDQQQNLKTNGCEGCRSLQNEVLRLTKVVNSQEEMMNVLKNKNSVLGKDNMQRMKEIVSLQSKFYEVQDKKAEIEYTEFMKFCQENNKQQQQKIQKLQKEIEKYRQAKFLNTKSIDIQCNIIDTDTSVQEKYNVLKRFCALKKEEIASLTEESERLKKLIEIHRNYTVNAEVQCNILSDESTLQKKYDSLKNVCRFRLQTIEELRSERDQLKSKLNM